MQINNQSPSYLLTADIGGSHITVAICDITDKSIVPGSVFRVQVNSCGSADDIFSSWETAIKASLNKHKLPVFGLSVAMPGPFDYENGICYIKGLDKYESLYGMDIKQYFASVMELDASQIRFRNDAESTIAGEVLAGAGKHYNAIMGVTLGTGFGSAYSVDHVTKDINLGSDPYQDTIADDYLSTRWFLKRYRELSGILLTGGVKELATLAEKDELAQLIFREFAINMSDFLSVALKKYHPEVLIICGNIAKASQFFLPYLQGRLKSITIELAQLGENAPLIGAAAIFNDTASHESLNSINKT